MKLPFVLSLALQLVSAQVVIEQQYLQSGPLLDNYSPSTGSARCALVNVAMDESGSMTTEQNFMKDDAIPGMLEKLYGPGFSYDHVFVCSNGFGYNYAAGPNYYQHLGCSLGFDNGTLVEPSILNWVANGYWEEGYHAMAYSIANVPQSINGINLQSDCGTLSKNIILVSDEDRDADFPATADQMKAYIDATGYILNLVVDSTIDGNTANVGMKSFAAGEEHVIYQADGGTTGGYTTYPKVDNYYNFVTHDTNWAPYTSEHYIPLIIDEPGAVWNVKSLRDGVYNNVALRKSFTNAFIDVKVQEISCPGGTLVGSVCTCPGGSLVGGVCTCTAPLINVGGQCSCPQGTTLSGGLCLSRTESSNVIITPPAPIDPNGGGDPHITTWNKEHYEYHGQCDLVMVKDPEFADGLGLDVHIRTKVVRYWSYIKTVAIKLGDDILEIEGSADTEDSEPHYWMNFEYQGELEEFSGFPVTKSFPVNYKRSFTIDLDSKYPGQSIIVQIYKEFVRVKFHNASKEAYGNSVGLLGGFENGKTLARDGSTVMHDFTEFGDEWQVLPSEPKLFHEIEQPQFPEICLKPEDPRGERQRRLDESVIPIEQAEAQCGKVLSDPLDIKDCVYDILATQDMGMAGAF